MQFLDEVTATITSERRARGPYGLQGGVAGQPGENQLLRDGHAQPLPAKVTLDLLPGDTLIIATPGGGGWGRADG